MNDNTLHDGILLDRLVDGELSDSERRELLVSLDAQPDGWRHCALAFLEAQAWGDDLGRLVREPQPADKAPSVKSPGGDERRALRRSAAWLVIAASVLVAFTLGLLQGDRGPASGTVAKDDAAPAMNEQIAAVAPAPAAEDDPAGKPLADALTLWVRDDGGQARPVRVPLVDAGTLERDLGLEFQSAIPADIRQRLQQRGYDVQSRRRFAPLWLENGRSMIVPVEDTKIVPISQNVY